MLLIGVVILLDFLQGKIKDNSWLIVIFKVILFLAIIFLYGLIVKYFAELFHIEWKGDF